MYDFYKPHNSYCQLSCFKNVNIFEDVPIEEASLPWWKFSRFSQFSHHLGEEQKDKHAKARECLLSYTKEGENIIMMMFWIGGHLSRWGSFVIPLMEGEGRAPPLTLSRGSHRTLHFRSTSTDPKCRVLFWDGQKMTIWTKNRPFALCHKYTRDSPLGCLFSK